MNFLFFKLSLFTLTLSAFAATSPDWSKGVEIQSPRENLYQLPPAEFQQTIMEGTRAALFYPVKVSELMIPYRPLKKFFETKPNDPVRAILYELAKIISPYQSMDEVLQWLGLHHFPTKTQSESPNPFPVLTSEEKSLRMGATLWETELGTGITFGCAACHTADLFGVTIIGLTNRFPRANEFFTQGAALAPYVNSFVFKDVLDTTEEERLMLVQAKKSLKYVGVKKPVTLGLDTSLAQVALSLAKRQDDAYATRTPFSHRFPRRNKLEKMIADSKPAVWWNLKYKNRWLSDGSIISGNPVHTNFLWNEIGRGTDLVELEKWLHENEQTINALTATVFATKPPRYEKFFGVNAIDIPKAQRGEKHFVVSCQRCHGTYEKGWSRDDAFTLNPEELIQTVSVKYHKRTPVRDVGTDPGRYLGMREFANDLNRLAISKSIGAVVEPQKGYVPPPLDGIWARWPYFHNNSAPNLCAVLTSGKKRPVTYVAGPANNKKTDFDQNCVGYPVGAKAPMAWKKDKDYFYDSRKEGLSNKGHDEGIFLRNGHEIYTTEQKLELIEFLKTL